MQEPRVNLPAAIRLYIIGSVIVWTGIFIASSVVLQGTDHFMTMLPILAGGAVWSILLAPNVFRRR